MKLKISYCQSLDILLLENGLSWIDGANVAENVVAFADAQRNPVAVEISGAASLLRPVLYADGPPSESRDKIHGRPEEADLDRAALRLIIWYDRKADVLSMESGLPMPFRQPVADGLAVFYDGEDAYGKFVNGVRLENAAKLLKPYFGATITPRPR